MIFIDGSSALKRAYPNQPARLRHVFVDHPLFEIERLAALAQTLPPECIEWNAGDLPIGHDPRTTPANKLSPVETIRRIHECGAWIVLKNVERDPEYRAALNECLGEFAPVASRSTGRMHRKVGFIFLSSPGAVTPLHLDPEHNVLMQIKGMKKIHIFPTDKGIIPAEHHESYHAGKAHRNLRHFPEYDAHAQAFDLGPGDAVFVPLKAPHWVKNGDRPSISFSVTWRSRASDNERRLRLANHAIRKLGGSPPEPGRAPARDSAKILAHQVVSKLRAAARI
ncbi:MAG: cupin-like domain-containing protein [Parvularculaceae bacterium]